MPTLAQLDPMNTELIPQFRNILSQLGSGQLTQAQQQALGQQRERGMQDIAASFVSRGAPTGARRQAEQGFMRDLSMQAALQAGQQQQSALQLGLPFAQLGARAGQFQQQLGLDERRLSEAQRQFNEQLAMQQYQLEAQYDPWNQLLGGLGQAIPYAGALLGQHWLGKK